MTAQFAESLRHEGETLSMCSQPLGDYFALSGLASPFVSTCTALWRGYQGTWEILGGRLYLIGLAGTLQGHAEATLATIFPEYPERVFAHWYSGTLRVPRGRRLQYVHMGYASTYEQDLLIDIERGIVCATRTRVNGVAADDDGPVGYGVAAATTLARRPGPEDGGAE